MVKCAVISCNNKSGKDLAEDVTFHPFPRDPLVKQVWIDVTGNGSDWNPDGHQICSDHFEAKCFQQLKKSRRVFVWAIPSLKLSINPPTVKEKVKVAAREQKDAEEPAEPDGETPELNEQIKKRKRLDEVFVKPLCSRCRKRAALNVSNTKLEGQAKSIVSKVYHFLSEEFRDIVDKYGDSIDLTPLSKFRERTAFACGVSYRAVGLVLKEEQDWLEARGTPVQEPPKKKIKIVQTEKAEGTINASEKEKREEKNFEAEQNRSEAVNAEEIELVERENSEEAQEETQNIENMDVNENYDKNNEMMESVAVEFEFHDIEPTSNQPEQQVIGEPPIFAMINQPGEQQVIGEPPIIAMINQPGEQQVNGEPPIIAIINQSGVEGDLEFHDTVPTSNQPVEQQLNGEPPIIAMINQSGTEGDLELHDIEPTSNQPGEQQVSGEPPVIAMQPPNPENAGQLLRIPSELTITPVHDLRMIRRPSTIEKQLKLYAVDRLTIREIITPLWSAEREPLRIRRIEPNLGLDPKLLGSFVEPQTMKIVDTCTNICCQQKATVTMICEPTDDNGEQLQDNSDQKATVTLICAPTDDNGEQLQHNSEDENPNDSVATDDEQRPSTSIEHHENEIENNLDNDIRNDLVENNLNNDIRNDLENEIENNLDNDFENEIENNLDNEIENDFENEIENDLDNEIENDFENEIENGLDNEIENELENDLDNEIENDFENEIENHLDNEIENEIENDLENDLENDFENEIDNNLDNEIENDLENEIENNLDSEIENNLDNEIIEVDDYDEEQSEDNSAVNFVNTACQTDRENEILPLIADGAQVYCNIDPAMAIGLPTLAHLDTQAIIAEPHYFAADAENMMNVQNVDYTDGQGYYVILN